MPLLLDSNSRFRYVVSDLSFDRSIQFTTRIELIYFLDQLSKVLQSNLSQTTKGIKIETFRKEYFGQTWSPLSVNTIYYDSLMMRKVDHVTVNTIGWETKSLPSKNMKMPKKKVRNLKNKVSKPGLEGKQNLRQPVLKKE